VIRWRPEELYVVLLALGVGLVSALLPAIQAYRTDIAQVLASRA
jgi:putative ABC transport system permease protein